MSKREDALSALFAVLSGIDADVLRGETFPERVSKKGLIILRDGDPGTPEITLSPMTYHYEHTAKIEVAIQSDDAHKDFDELLVKTGQAIYDDKTLGGVCDWIVLSAPQISDLPAEDAMIKAAILDVVLYYSTESPLL